MGAFIIGMVIASLVALIAGVLTDMGLWTCLALWVSVVVVSQILYVLSIAFLAIGREMNGGQNGANADAAQQHKPARGLNGEKMSHK